MNAKWQKIRLGPQVRNSFPFRIVLHFGTAEIGRYLTPYLKILGLGKWATRDVGFDRVHPDFRTIKSFVSEILKEKRGGQKSGDLAIESSGESTT
jgi:hypothetical protein